MALALLGLLLRQPHGVHRSGQENLEKAGGIPCEYPRRRHFCPCRRRREKIGQRASLLYKYNKKDSGNHSNVKRKKHVFENDTPDIIIILRSKDVFFGLQVKTFLLPIETRIALQFCTAKVPNPRTLLKNRFLGANWIHNEPAQIHAEPKFAPNY